MFLLGMQDLLHRKLLVVGKELTMGLGCAPHSLIYAQTEMCMHFGIHSIHQKRRASLLWSKLCLVLKDT